MQNIDDGVLELLVKLLKRVAERLTECNVNGLRHQRRKTLSAINSWKFQYGHNRHHLFRSRYNQTIRHDNT